MILIENLHKYYGTVRALDGLNMNIEPGAVYGFLGPNGAGKTTTLRILTGLARPTSGQATVAGIYLARDGRTLSSRIGYLPEEPAFYPWMTPVEFLDYLGKLHGLSTADRVSRTRELLELVNLVEAGKRRMAGFSRGMRQRMGLAAALVHRPEVLLLDEPVSALDPSGRKEVLDLIRKLSGQATVLMSSHILADVERVCNVVGIVARGRMLVQSSRDALMQQYAQPVFEMEGQELAPMQRWADLLKDQAWVSGLSLEKNVLRVTVSDVGRARKELLSSAVVQEVILTRYQEMRPSLEDIFLQLIDHEVAQ